VPHTVSAGDFNFADTDIGDQLQAVQITALPGAGALTLSGGTILPGQSITVADVNAGNLVYTPVDYATGVGYASFDFKVSDGFDFSASAYTVTIDVLPRAGLVNVELDWIGRDRVNYLTGVGAIGTASELGNRQLEFDGLLELRWVTLLQSAA
jgi:hypothetical protein